jgi:[acyl-carrier-protein] S-malonyltransferase
VLTGMAKRSAPGALAAAASEPAALDGIAEVAAAAGALDHHDGEHLFAAERLVVSPAAGVFTPASDVAEGQHIERGRVVGHVAGHEVRSPFRGTVKGLLAVAGERLTRSQPVAWLRTA